MIDRILKSRLLFFWISSFSIAYLSYYVLWLIMPNHRVFGSLYRMLGYHYAFPLQYIAIPCFFYGIFASLFATRFKKGKRLGRIFITVLIIVLTILVSSLFGGMLWHFHDMLLGYFPDNWVSKMITKGSAWGFEMGWYIILLSIPYNVFGAIVCFFLTKKGIELYRDE